MLAVALIVSDEKGIPEIGRITHVDSWNDAYEEAMRMIRDNQPNGVLETVKIAGKRVVGEEEVFNYLQSQNQWSQVDGSTWYSNIEDEILENEDVEVFAVQIVEIN